MKQVKRINQAIYDLLHATSFHVVGTGNCNTKKCMKRCITKRYIKLLWKTINMYADVKVIESYKKTI